MPQKRQRSAEEGRHHGEKQVSTSCSIQVANFIVPPYLQAAAASVLKIRWLYQPLLLHAVPVDIGRYSASFPSVKGPEGKEQSAMAAEGGLRMMYLQRMLLLSSRGTV